MAGSDRKSFYIPPLNLWVKPVILAWLLPGSGHFYLKRERHGVLVFFAVVGMFVCGLLMRGQMFEPKFGDLFTTVVNCGGYIGDIAVGALYFLVKWLGYNQVQLATATADYGTKFLVCSGLLNILAIVDTFEISTGEKS